MNDDDDDDDGDGAKELKSLLLGASGLDLKSMLYIEQCALDMIGY